MGIKKGFSGIAYLRRRAADGGSRGGNAPLAMPDGDETTDTLGACARMWLESLAARNIAQGTIEAHQHCMRWFSEWAVERDVRRAGEVSRPVLEAYQRWLSRVEPERGRGKGKHLSWSTQRARLHTLKEWFRWLTRHNVILHNPASEIELPRHEKRLPVATLTLGEVETLLAIHDLADPLGVRDRAMCEVFYSTGIRRAELAHLGITDINTERGTLTVRHGKGGKDRVVPLGARAGAWVARYLDEVRPRLLLDAREQTLFLTGYGEAFNPDVLSRMMSAWMRAAGLAGRGSCHQLRHACATHMLEGGADIRFIQQLLGHESLETTQIYTQVTITQLLEVHARCHPAGHLEKAPEKNSKKDEENASHLPMETAPFPTCQPSAQTLPL